VEAHREGGLTPSRPRTRTSLCGAKGTSQTIHLRGHASRPGSPGVRVTERHLRLTEKLLCEQRRNLLEFLVEVGRQMANVPQGQRVRSSRWSDDHPGRRRNACTGRRDLKTRGLYESLDRTVICCHNGTETESDMVGPPDARKRACPVRGALDGNLLLRSSKALSFDSIARAKGSPKPWE